MQVENEACIGNLFFGYGLGIGMMCMMSAGKSEINRLNVTMDETAKAVEELKAELSRRKVAHDLRASKNKAEVDEKHDRECRIRVIAESSNGNSNIYRVLDHQVAEEGECASSVVTEEPQPELMEMDQLEAELESELQMEVAEEGECASSVVTLCLNLDALYKKFLVLF
ncbi:hypothetical protein CQW23_35010 [Capsicum baccatum]|uniref:Uncharacterized protein n=1 Tax=Capsicum baccatum TaxID=33114 RepID=A0A2G2UXK0_CAPBA|nr:hypothetical protein CQW23_35010 [Capsicum baccatum]